LRGDRKYHITQAAHRTVSVSHRALEEWGATDVEARRQVTTQSVWKLNCGVTVGGQTILGIKHLHEPPTRTP